MVLIRFSWFLTLVSSTKFNILFKVILNSGLLLSLLAYLFVSSTNKEAISKNTFSKDDKAVNPTFQAIPAKVLEHFYLGLV